MPERIQTLSLEVGGERCAASLHLPEGPEPHPCVVMLHSTAGVREMTCYAGRAARFSRAGVATLQFDCRGFGASDGTPRQLLDVRRQAEDLAVALDRAGELPEVDGGRLALWGASAGCGIVLAAAKHRSEVRGIVCLAPFVPGRATQRSARTPVARLARAAFADRLRMLAGRRPLGVKVGGEPGEAAILVREEAAAGERSLLPEAARLEPSGQRAELGNGVVWENRVVLRLRLRTPNPLRVARKVAVPVLVVTGDRDPLCPPGAAAELAGRAPAGRLVRLACGHFDLYRGAAADAEAEFLADVLRRPRERRPSP